MYSDGDVPEKRKQARRAMELEALGKILLVGGGVVFALGGVLVIVSRLPGLSGLRLFDLPGDVRIQTGNLTCMVPIVSMIIVSIVATLIVNLIIRFLNR